MLLANIRGTKAQLRALTGKALRHHHDGLRRISKTLFELPAVLDEGETRLVTDTGAELLALGDVQDLLSARLARASGRAHSFTSRQDLLDSMANNRAYLETGFIESWIGGLGNLFPEWCTPFQLPNKSW